jgi:hypothetical protein
VLAVAGILITVNQIDGEYSAAVVPGVDQTAQRALSLLGPVRAGMALFGVGEVPQ